MKYSHSYVNIWFIADYSPRNGNVHKILWFILHRYVSWSPHIINHKRTARPNRWARPEFQWALRFRSGKDLKHLWENQKIGFQTETTLEVHVVLTCFCAELCLIRASFLSVENIFKIHLIKQTQGFQFHEKKAKRDATSNADNMLKSSVIYLLLVLHRLYFTFV